MCYIMAGAPRTRHISIRVLSFDYEWYAKVARAVNRPVTEVMKDALTAYRTLMQLPGVSLFKTLPELRGELVGAQQAGVPIADVPNDDGRPKRRRKGRPGDK